MRKIFDVTSPWFGILIVAFLFGVVFLFDEIFNMYYYRNHIATIAKTPTEINSKLKELGVMECRGTFASNNPFKKEFLSIYIYDKKKDESGKEYVKYKYDTGHSDFDVDTTENFKHWKFKDCSQIVELNVRYHI